MPVHVTGPDDIRHIAYFALAIKWNERVSHLGAFFRDADDNLRLLHLAFHLELTNEAPKAGYAWCKIRDVDYLAEEQIALGFSRIAERYEDGKLSYSFDNDAEFEDDFSLTTDAPGTGFTCATFILRVLENRGLHLIDQATWGEREGDRAWQQWVIDTIRAEHGESAAEHVEALKGKKGAFRFQPLDVVAAADLKRPASMEAVEAALPAVRAALSGTGCAF